MNPWKITFPGKRHCLEKVRAWPTPPPLFYERHWRVPRVIGQQVLAVLYNSGRHLYWDWSDRWPQKYEDWEQPWEWLGYRKFRNGGRLSHCALYHLGHGPAAIGYAEVAIVTKNHVHRDVRLNPGTVYYLIDFGKGAETLFPGKPNVVVPQELLLLG